MGFLLPTTRTTVTAGQTDEFSVTSSRYGRGIPKVYGTDRIGGNIIWADNIREERTEETQSQGGKGAPKQETTTVTFRYYVDMAASFGEGPATSLRRLWGDGKLIYDATVSPVDRLSGLNFTVYLGTETQTPDPLIETNVGENLTPAYRGQVYIVFDDFPLANFGNRIPALTAEFAYGDEEADVTEIPFPAVANPNGARASDNVVYDTSTGRIYGQNNGSTNIGWDATTGALVDTWTQSFLLSNSPNRIAMLGFVYMEDAEDSSLRDSFIRAPQIQAASNIFEAGSNGVVSINTEMGHFDHKSTELGGQTGWLIIGGDTIGSSGDLRVEVQNTSGNTLSSLNINNSYAATRTTVGGDGEGFGIGVLSGTLTVWRGTSSGVSVLAGITNADPILAAAGAGTITTTSLIAYDPVLDYLIIHFAASGGYSMAVNAATGEVVWCTSVPFTASGHAAENGAYLNGGFNVWISGRRIIRQNSANGNIDSNLNGFKNNTASDSYAGLIWIEELGILWARNQSNASITTAIRINTGEGADLNPRLVIQDICERTGLDTSEIDVSQLPTTETGVKSLILDERIVARDALEPFLQLLQIDAIESDGALTFVNRGVLTSSLTLTEDDLIAGEDGNVYVRPRLRETELPLRFEVGFRDPENQYQDNVQSDEREASAVSTVEIKTLEYKGAITSDAARQIASNLLFEAWSERERLPFQVPPSRLAMDPADVITVNLDTGESLQLRIRTADLGANFILDAEGVVQTTDLFVDSGILGDSGDSNQVTSPTFAGDSSTFIFDTPLLRDADAATTGQTNAYWSGSGEPVWNGVILYRSVGDTTVENVAKQVQPIPFGVVETALPDATRFSVFDEDNDLVVRMTRGAELMTSITELDVLNGGNVLLVVKANGEVEFLQFQTASPDGIDANLITLSRILRGRRGTDTMARGMAQGDQVFLMISSAYVNAFKRDISTLNTLTSYTGVTVGQFFEDAEAQNFTDTGRDLKPYAPVEIEVTQPGGAGTDLTFTWTRRTRIGGSDDFGNGVLDVPLGEDTEDYDLVIYSDGTYQTETRVINVSSESATYTSADITTDGDPTTIFFRVFQRSAQVGRGFATDQTTPRDL